MKNRLVMHYHLKGKMIYLRLTVNGERTECTTNRRINPDSWNKITEKVKGDDETNSYLLGFSAKVQRIFNKLDSDERLSVSQITDELKGSGLNKMTILEAYQYHIDTISKLKDISFAPATIDKYGYTFNSLKRFVGSRNIKLSDLNIKFIQEYYSFLLTKGGLSPNSASKYIKNLKRVISISITNRWINQDPFRGFTCSYVNPVRNFLSQEEIDNIYNKVFSIDRLSRVRDLFIFQCYTGLAYCDMELLIPENIEIGIDNRPWIVIYRHKTKTRSAIPLLPRARAILQKYNNKLPVTSNQKMNAYLKEISDLCNISKPLTTHLGRHTFASSICLSNNIPIESISKMLGHTKISTTQIYAKVTDQKVSRDMERLFN